MKDFDKTIVLISMLFAPFSLAATNDSLITFRALTPEAALEIAQVTMAACREAGYQVSVAVVDRSGVTQVLLRDGVAGPHTLETARRKAWTAASFKGDTRSIAQATQPGSGQSGARFATEAIMVGGGVPLYAEGSVVGAVGVSGSPGADEDQTCAEQGAAALEEKLLF